MPQNAVDRIDSFPENVTYHDDGCGNGCARSLECPFPRCRYDEPGIWLKIKRGRRDDEVLALRLAEGLGVRELSARLGISRRTVHRILARARQTAPAVA